MCDQEDKTIVHKGHETLNQTAAIESEHILLPPESEAETPTLPQNEENKPINVLMVGLDNSGKTQLLYTLQLGYVVENIRTIGYNVESLKYNSIEYKIWDIGGHKTVRVLRNFYTENISIVIYVVDASDDKRFAEAQQDLQDVMNNSNLSNAVLLVLVNKIDLAPDLIINEVVERLNLNGIKQKWMIHTCSAVTDGKKLYEIYEKMEELKSKT